MKLRFITPFFALLLFTIICSSFITPPGGGPKYSAELKSANNELIDSLFPQLQESEIWRLLGPITRSEIHNYLSEKELTQDLIARGDVYFPIIEEVFTRYDIPKELKYLAVIESKLKYYATSGDDAIGLWQFMFLTAREYGLICDFYIDERRDPYKSTEAAAKYLRWLHDRYGDWNLVLAAYNCGTNSVSKAAKKAGSKDFHKVYEHLPNETRHFFPRYQAAIYIFNNFQQHGLQKGWPNVNLHYSYIMTLDGPYSLLGLIQEGWIDQEQFKELNPSILNFELGDHYFPMDVKIPEF